MVVPWKNFYGGIRENFQKTSSLFFFALLSHYILTFTWLKSKHNCSGPTTFKSPGVGYQSNQKVLHHHQHSKYHLN